MMRLFALTLALLCGIAPISAINRSIDQSTDSAAPAGPIITSVSGCDDNGPVTENCRFDQSITITGQWVIESSDQFYVNIQSEYWVWGNLTQSNNQSINQLVFCAPSIKQSLESVFLNVQIRDSIGQWSDPFKGIKYELIDQSSSTGSSNDQSSSSSNNQSNNQSSSTGSSGEGVIGFISHQWIMFAAIGGGSVIGIICLYAIYRHCCRSNNQSNNQSNSQLINQSNNRSNNQTNDMRRPILAASAQYGF